MVRPLMKRRNLLLLAGGGVLALAAGARFGGSRLARAGAPSGPLSARARELIAAAWKGLNPARVLDAHVHVVGLGVGGTGCYVNPRMLSLSHPIHYAKFNIYKTAAGVLTDEAGDAEYRDRLLGLVRAQEPRGRLLILAFDQTYSEDGVALPEKTEFHTPNDYVLQLARENPDVLVPGASIHPYRKDAVAELERVAALGAQVIKWLPNSQHIDPSSPRCDPFYDKLAELKVPLLSHAGEEQAVEGGEAQLLGNPLHLRRPLSKGVKVLVAHCGSLGQNPDLDAAGAEKPRVDNFDLFLRLMAERQYEGQLFGELSALPQVNRLDRPLRQMLLRGDLHARCINGSDYPLPAVNAVMRTGALESFGFLTGPERAALNEIDQHNPLLFDFVLKRTLRAHKDGVAHGFSDEAFMLRPGIFPGLS